MKTTETENDALSSKSRPFKKKAGRIYLIIMNFNSQFKSGVCSVILPKIGRVLPHTNNLVQVTLLVSYAYSSAVVSSNVVIISNFP